MTRRLMKGLVLAATLLSAVACASPASAANWSTNGPLNYTATAPTAKFTIASPSNPVFICTTVSATGTLNGPTGPLATTSWNAGTVTRKFTGCTIAGWTYAVTCSASDLTVDPPAIQPQPLRLAMNCTIVRGTCTISLVGSVNGSYVNLTGVLKVFKAGQVLTASAPAACSGFTGAPSGGSWTANYFNNTTSGDLDYTVISTPKPSIT